MWRVPPRTIVRRSLLYPLTTLHDFSSANKKISEESPKSGFRQKFFQSFLKMAQLTVQVQINVFQLMCTRLNQMHNVQVGHLGLQLSPAIKSPALRAQQPSTGGVLPASIEETFEELRTRRGRITELLGTVEELKSANQKLTLDRTDAERAKAVALSAGEKIKGSFQGIDQRFIDLRDEVINLREVESKYKTLTRKHHDLEASYTKAVRDGSTSRNTASDTKSQALLASTALEVQRLEKRIERLRNQSPAMVALYGVFSAIIKSSNPDKFHHDALNEDLATVQRKYAEILTNAFPVQCEAIGARELLVRACIEHVRSSFFYGGFDCQIHCPSGIDQKLTQLLNGQIENGFQIRRLSNTSIEVACPDQTSGVGPYGLLSCFLRAFPERASGMRVYPTITEMTIRRHSKVKILHETCKSSKPGGQAANVTETQVKSALMFDGRVIARASSQDTPSQQVNKKRAEQRLIEESLETDKKKWEASPPTFPKVILRSGDFDSIRYLFETSDYRAQLYFRGVLQSDE
ncbi:hypothetical protein XU18_3921 [Perkinsela sp. CCAP 1560/4]|nr:hypothetical protein XU18_3921 [Perkinsela sp. CCAP 1560/4]|eukprot:KNH04937.1 hypothetical protein XU18_3921 [Perkinsela sp. CCAP 1560/4]